MRCRSTSRRTVKQTLRGFFLKKKGMVLPTETPIIVFLVLFISVFWGFHLLCSFNHTHNRTELL